MPRNQIGQVAAAIDDGPNSGTIRIVPDLAAPFPRDRPERSDITVFVTPPCIRRPSTTG